jgi:hypothetical protein
MVMKTRLFNDRDFLLVNIPRIAGRIIPDPRRLKVNNSRSMTFGNSTASSIPRLPISTVLILETSRLFTGLATVLPRYCSYKSSLLQYLCF